MSFGISQIINLEAKLFCPIHWRGEEEHTKQRIKKNSADVGVSLGLRDWERHQGCASFVVRVSV